MLTPDICATMLQHHEAMLSAARENDLEKLAALERTVSDLRRQASEGGSAKQLSEQEQTTLKGQIARILELEAQILERVEPLLEETRELLVGSAKDRVVKKAYGAFAP